MSSKNPGKKRTVSAEPIHNPAPIVADIESKEQRKEVANNGSISKYMPYIFLLLIALFMIFTRSQFLGIGMERDEGIYSYFGKLLLEGKTPYIDLYETRFPGTFYMYAVLVGIFGYSIQGVAVGILVLNLFSMGILYDMTRRLLNVSAGVIAAATFACLSLAPAISGFTRQSEHIVVFWELLGAWLMVKALQDDKWWQFVLSGVAMCMAMLVKPNAVYLIVGVGMVLLAKYLTETGINWKKMILNGVLYSSGVFGMFGLMCLGMVVQGAWSEFWYFAVVEAGKYSEGIPWEQGKEMFNLTYNALSKKYSIFMYLSYMGLIAVWFTSDGLYKKASVVILFLLGFWTITPGLRFYGHYWLMWMPFVAMAVGAVFYALQKIIDRFLHAPAWSAYTSLLFALPFLMHIMDNERYYFSPNHDKILRQTYGTNPFPEAQKIGEYIAKQAKEGDKIALVGSEPQTYVYTGCNSPTRHAYFSYLMFDTLKTPKAIEWQKEYIADLEREKPRFIAFYSHNISILANPNSDMKFFQWFDPFINQNYKRIAVADIFDANNTKYAWGEAEAAAYQPQNKQHCVYVFERK